VGPIGEPWEPHRTAPNRYEGTSSSRLRTFDPHPASGEHRSGAAAQPRWWSSRDRQSRGVL